MFCKKKNILSSILLFICFISFSQANKRLLPPTINQSSNNLFAPAISGDESTILYLSDYTEDGYHSMYFSTKTGVSIWNEPIEISKSINRPTHNYRGGFTLSFTGDELFYTSRKSGFGGFDIWSAKKTGSNYGNERNMGKIINSDSNEATPSLSTTGDELYFMRCEKMDEYHGAKNCKIMMATKRFNQWSDVKELPANINTGNSQNPKILSDNQTLIFSSDQFKGKGGLDLFISKKIGNEWSDPIPMSFMNTEKDDQFVSIPAKGRYLYTSQFNGRNHQLVQLLIPTEFRPNKVLRLSGIVSHDSENLPLNAKIIVFDVTKNTRIWNHNINESGQFSLILNQGTKYDLSITHSSNNYFYYEKFLDLEKISGKDKEHISVEFSSIKKEKEYILNISFKDNSDKIDENSIYSVRRLANFLKRNNTQLFEINIIQTNYLEDTIRSSKDLTEVKTDTIYSKVYSALEDSIKTFSNKKGSSKDTTQFSKKETNQSFDFPNDSLQYIEVSSIIKIYHNNRTLKQSKELKKTLLKKGCLEKNLLFKTSVKKKEAINNDDSQKKDVIVVLKLLSNQ